MTSIDKIVLLSRTRPRCCSRCACHRPTGERNGRAQEQAIAQLLSQHNQILVCSYLPRTAGQYYGGHQLNESPQAQEPPAFGLSIVKPCFSMVSTKSIVAPCDVGGAHPVDRQLDAAELGGQVAVERPVVEEEVVAQAGATAGLDGDAQRQVVAALLVQQRLRLGGRGVGRIDAVGVVADSS